MKILVIGGGAREHAILWKLSHEHQPHHLFCAPGNAGTAAIATNIPIPQDDIPALLAWAQANHPDLTVVGPEAPLAAGIVNQFDAVGLPIFGPTREAARLESSKAFSKKFMEEYNIPHARGETYTDLEAARHHIRTCQPPYVIKADGLAGGKGVVITHKRDEALATIQSFMQERTLGDAGASIIIEEELSGVEVSILAFTDGNYVQVMVPAQDYKRAFDGDRGPNTGGMGAFAPSTHIGDIAMERITIEIIRPIVRAMKNIGAPFKGVLYTGMIITPEGPKVLEFNARFGDPETQVILPMLETSLLGIMTSVVEGTLRAEEIRWSDGYCCGIVLASEGYPGEYAKSQIITGLETVESAAMVFHAGTRLIESQKSKPQLVTNGGRVLTVVAKGQTLREACQSAYRNAEKIKFHGKFNRTDIGRLHA